MSKEEPRQDVLLRGKIDLRDGLVVVDITLKNVWVDDDMPPAVLGLDSSDPRVDLRRVGGYHEGNDTYYLYVLVCPSDTNLDAVHDALRDLIFTSAARAFADQLTT